MLKSLGKPILTVPKRHFDQIYIMEYKPPPTQQVQINFGALQAQECTYVNDTAFLLCPDLFKKKIDLPTLPIFRPKGQTNLLFFRPKYDVNMRGFSTNSRFVSAFEVMEKIDNKWVKSSIRTKMEDGNHENY